MKQNMEEFPVQCAVITNRCVLIKHVTTGQLNENY